MLGRSTPKEKRTRLAALTLSAQLGMLRTHVRRVDACVLAREELGHSGGNTLVVCLSEQAARDSRLIGDDNHGNPRPVQARDRAGRARSEYDELRLSDVVHVVDDGSVAIEKRRTAGGRFTHERLRITASSAAASTRSSRGATVRRSSSKRPSVTRPITAGAPRRNALSIAPASPLMARATDGMRAAGNAPPPTLASLSTTSTRVENAASSSH